MSKYIITIDVTSNVTRAVLWNKNGQAVACTEESIGLSNTVSDGNNEKLKKAARNCIERLLEQEKITYEDLWKVVASGMLTSGIGLYEIPHVYAPAGMKELAEQAKEVMMEDVCPIPITFIPGVKNHLDNVTWDNFEEMDIMRGEEIDCVAVLDSFPKGKPYLVVLSEYYHTKFITVDELGRMTGCLTTITGDLLSCITNHTDIGDSVGRAFVSENDYDRDVMLKGFSASEQVGLGRIGFSTKILNIFVEKDKTKLVNFILGAAFANDLQCIKNTSALKVNEEMTVLISAKRPLSSALKDIFEFDGYFKCVKEFVAKDDVPLPAAGSYLVSKCIK